MDIQQKALASGGRERLGPSSKALVAVGGTKSSTALVQQKKAATLPKPQWHPPWKLMRVRVWCYFVKTIANTLVNLLEFHLNFRSK